MDNENVETYEVQADEEYYDDSDPTLADYGAILFLAVLGCAVIAFILHHFRKTFGKLNVKVGEKINVGVETRGKDE